MAPTSPQDAADAHAPLVVQASLASLADELDATLANADRALRDGYPGERSGRQPVHTVYVPADRYSERLVPDWGAAALAALDADPDGFRGVLGEDEGEGGLDDRVRAKLGRRADRGPAHRLRGRLRRSTRRRGGPGRPRRGASPARLDRPRRRAAVPRHPVQELRGAHPPARAAHPRVFLEELAGAGSLPEGFVVTLPKVTSVEQVEAMVLAASRLEAVLGLAAGRLRFEIQVETPQSILGPDGTALVARMVHAAAGRCTGLHYGTYDYSASCGIAAALPEHGAPRRRPRQGGHAGGRSGHRRATVRRLHQRPAGRRAADAVRAALGACTTGSSAAPSSAATTRAGTCTRPSCPPATPPCSPSTATGSARPRTGCAATSSARDSGFLDEPATARALADFCCAASTAARSAPTRPTASAASMPPASRYSPAEWPAEPLTGWPRAPR